MDYKVFILAQAQLEIEEAFEYYARFSTLALENFNSQLEHAYQSLETNPFFQIHYNNLRMLPLKSFPYLIFFTLEEQEKSVYIYAVFNTYQNPSKYPTL